MYKEDLVLNNLGGCNAIKQNQTKPNQIKNRSSFFNNNFNF